jgi:hypothetical protein
MGTLRFYDVLCTQTRLIPLLAWLTLCFPGSPGVACVGCWDGLRVVVKGARVQ